MTSDTEQDRTSNTEQDRKTRDPQNGPGITNSIPDDADKGEATALPDSDREQTEIAGKPDA